MFMIGSSRLGVNGFKELGEMTNNPLINIWISNTLFNKYVIFEYTKKHFFICPMIETSITEYSTKMENIEIGFFWENIESIPHRLKNSFNWLAFYHLFWYNGMSISHLLHLSQFQ